MAIAKLVRKVKRPYGLWVKMTAVTMLGLCFIFVSGVFSNSSSSITTQRKSFEDIIEPSSSSSTSSKGVQTQTQLPHKKEETKAEEKQHFGDVSNKEKDVSGEDEKKDKVRANEVSESDGNDESEDKEDKEESEGELEGEKEGSDRDGKVGMDFEIICLLLKNAKGLAILTVAKAGALLSYKIGTGLVVVRRADGSWSAPSAVLSLGLGWGAQIGGELMNFIFILHDIKSVKAFCNRMHFSLGAGCSAAAGPVGRVLEADVCVGDRGSGMCYTYSCSKGSF
ncbi:hypothetical protein Ahy_A07g032879 [Arachis hypogaea]|uniref:Ysc84 actin-binding domain-containing protein n=1 Tax=Arachis hypogaea TaxID=3818 RepID=A0A445C7S1_ARAHY|nr:hypothetical protein Ahy_A07g032879 [Arachis hypogaea]